MSVGRRGQFSPGRYASLVDTASIPAGPSAWTRRLLRCGVAAGPVFMAVFLLEGALREGYRPLQRASIITGFTWLSAVSARALQRASATSSTNPAASTAPLPGASTRT